MPIVPVQPLKPYPTVGDVLQLARVIVLDASGPNGVAGDLLSSSQPFTLVLLNSAFERLQTELTNAGVESLTKEIVITNLSAISTPDPTVNTYLTWDGYFDGTTFNSVSGGAPALPQDLIQPLEVLERQSGSNSVFVRVTPIDGGLPEIRQGAALGYYEWRDDKIFFKGATTARDLRLRYASWQPALAIDDVIEIPIMRCNRAMAYLIASEWARSRGAAVADNLYAMAEMEIKAITNRTARRKASIPYRRRAYGY
jgi:hypothetical protein